MECYIVEALLQNYADGLTSDETNREIEQHLSKCINCQQMLEQIQNRKQEEPDRAANKRQIKYLKKIGTVFKILTILAAIIGWLIIILAIGSMIYMKVIFA